MWFELINTAIAAAGLGLASMPLFKKTTASLQANPLKTHNSGETSSQLAVMEKRQ